MRIALFGGSFDPPHIGHQMACLYVLETHDIDELWLVPCFQHPFEKRTAAFAHRVAMCRLAAAALSPRVQVCTVEEELQGPSYTLSTVRALSARHPQHEFLLVIGADLLHERERWHGFPELAERVRFIVLGRSSDRRLSSPLVHAAGSEARKAQPMTHAPSSAPAVVPRDLRHADPLDLPAVSSTGVRSELVASRLPSGWVSRSVLAYIQEQALYVDRSASAAAVRDGARTEEGTDAIRR